MFIYQSPKYSFSVLITLFFYKNIKRAAVESQTIFSLTAENKSDAGLIMLNL